jgi:hypothetical protein
MTREVAPAVLVIHELAAEREAIQGGNARAFDPSLEPVDSSTRVLHPYPAARLYWAHETT